jgi:hypothetical protein
VDEQVAQRRPLGAGGAAVQYQHDGCDGHQLPANDQGEKVTGEDHAEGAASVQQRRHLLGPVAQVQREDAAQEGQDAEHVAEDEAQVIDAERGYLHTPPSRSPDGACL